MQRTGSLDRNFFFLYCLFMTRLKKNHTVKLETLSLEEKKKVLFSRRVFRVFRLSSEFDFCGFAAVNECTHILWKMSGLSFIISPCFLEASDETDHRRICGFMLAFS